MFYVITALLSLLTVASFTFCNDSLVKFFCFVFLVFLTFLTVNGLSGNIHSKDGSLMLVPDVLITAIITTFENLPVPFRSFSASAKSGKQKTAYGVLIGLGVSLPLLAIIITLLTSADIAFNSLISNIFSNIFVLIICVLFALVFTPFLFSYIFTSSRHGELSDSKVNWNIKYGNVLASVSVTVLSVISAVYVLYLFSQLAYITKAFSFLLPDDFTKAEFARRGFFEMAVIVFINLLIIAVFSIITKRNDNAKLPLSIKLLLTFLNIFSLFFTVSAFSRMAQYIAAYGLTRLRVFTSVFMIMLFLILIVVLIKLYAKRLNYIKPIIVICSLTLLFMSFANVNTVISKYNYRLYIETATEIDVDCIGLLGKSAVPELLKLSESKDENISRSAMYYLFDYYNSEFETINKDGSYVLNNSDFENYNYVDKTIEKEFIEYAKSHSGFLYNIKNNPECSNYVDY